jgi:hypothetical protein
MAGRPRGLPETRGALRAKVAGLALSARARMRLPAVGASAGSWGGNGRSRHWPVSDAARSDRRASRRARRPRVRVPASRVAHVEAPCEPPRFKLRAAVASWRRRLAGTSLNPDRAGRCRVPATTADVSHGCVFIVDPERRPHAGERRAEHEPGDITVT